ncbi:MAG TPA: response regulator [Bacteroidota bacterium]|nr:response regulator [Bacteroidota bacterium]
MGNHTILIVEDEAIIAAAESQLLKTRGYEVRTAPGGDEAIAAVRSRPGEIDLILMDINLGRGKDGAAAAREILREGSMPILFVSSLPEEEIAARTKGISSCGTVSKNAGDAELLAAVEAALARRPESAQVAALRA